MYASIQACVRADFQCSHFFDFPVGEHQGYLPSINFISSNKWGNTSTHRIDIECSSCLAYKKPSASYLQTILCIFWLNLCLQIQLLNPQQSSKDIGVEINLEKNHSIQKWWASFRRQRLVDCLKHN